MKSIHIRLQWLLLLSCIAQAKPQVPCDARLRQQAFAKLGPVRTGSLNLQDLSLPEGEMDAATRKRAEHFARIIRENRLDLVATMEMVDDAEFRFVREFLDGEFDFYRTAYQANRGIHNTLLVRKTLPLEVGNPRSFGHEQWRDPLSTSQAPMQLYHRDTPLFELYAPGWVGREAPVLSLMIAHLKSRKDRELDFHGNALRNTDRRSTAMRQAQFERMMQNYQIWQDKHYVQWRKPGAFIVVGDMNGVLATDDEFASLARTDLRDAFDALGVPANDFSRVTHVYLRGATTLPVFEQINAFLLSSDLQSLVMRAKVDTYDFPAQNFRSSTEGLAAAAQALPSRHFANMLELNVAPRVQLTLAARPAWARTSEEP